jgi:MGT family glycosyltransferase
VVRELAARGNAIRYYSFTPFKPVLEEAGAEVICCDQWLPPADPAALKRTVGRDFSALMAMVADTTLNMGQTVCAQLEDWQPACVVADSVCFWGKLFAQKLALPLVCSTTTFAFNAAAARRIHRRPGETARLLLGMPRVAGKLRQLRCQGYPVRDLRGLLANDNDTDTVVYTSRAFQPMAETFSNRYAFVGPTVRPPARRAQTGERPLIYVSLGTVLNCRPDFYRACAAAFAGGPAEVLISVGGQLSPAELGPLPPNVTAVSRVNQPEVLSRAAVFVTHCGMNSAGEAILCGVPTVLCPQQSEEGAVADRMEELGLGVRPRGETPAALRAAAEEALQNEGYRLRTAAMAKTFLQAGGAAAAADKILQTAGV